MVLGLANHAGMAPFNFDLSLTECENICGLTIPPCQRISYNAAKKRCVAIKVGTPFIIQKDPEWATYESTCAPTTVTTTTTSTTTTFTTTTHTTTTTTTTTSTTTTSTTTWCGFGHGAQSYGKMDVTNLGSSGFMFPGNTKDKDACEGLCGQKNPPCQRYSYSAALKKCIVVNVGTLAPQDKDPRWVTYQQTCGPPEDEQCLLVCPPRDTRRRLRRVSTAPGP